VKKVRKIANSWRACALLFGQQLDEEIKRKGKEKERKVRVGLGTNSETQ